MDREAILRVVREAGTFEVDCGQPFVEFVGARHLASAVRTAPAPCAPQCRSRRLYLVDLPLICEDGLTCPVVSSALAQVDLVPGCPEAARALRDALFLDADLRARLFRPYETGRGGADPALVVALSDLWPDESVPEIRQLRAPYFQGDRMGTTFSFAYVTAGVFRGQWTILAMDR